MSVETYYTVLGVSETASQTEIKAAYKELVRQVHPDCVPNASPYWKRAAEEKTKEINEAYRILSNASKRREYDRLLAEARQGMHPQPSQSPTTPPPQQPAPQPPPSGPYWAKYNWNSFRHWAAKHPVLLGFLGIFACGIVLSLLPDSSAPTPSQTRAVAPVANNTPAPTASTAPARPVNPAPPVAPLKEDVNSASYAYRLDPDLVNSVIHAESGFNARPISPRKVAQHLRELLERYNFDLIKALAAYNAGPERVEQYNGVPPEAKAYVARVVRDFNKKKLMPRSGRRPTRNLIPVVLLPISRTLTFRVHNICLTRSRNTLQKHQLCRRADLICLA